jgi:tRNA-2-methylthio-N6-dimethylallyladenosine synthase
MTERTFCIQTFGCQMNVNDSQWLARALVRRGFAEAAPDLADVHILNTCSVREKPEKKVYSALGRVRQVSAGRFGAFAVVAGCVAQQLGAELFRRFPQVRLVVGGDGLCMAPDAIERLCEDRFLTLNLTDFASAYPERAPELEGEFSGTAAVGAVAYVTIMQGCDNFCAYCIVPYTRGRQKSRAEDDILAECRELLDHGAREIVLLGQNVNAYGRDRGDGVSFAGLLHRIAALPGIVRLRFVTPHPRDFAPDTVAAFAELPILSSHLHLPVQSGSDAVLTRMGRAYSRADYLRLVERLYRARPDIAIGTDIIVGFPGESERDFKDTLSLMRAVPYASSFSFRYSDRPGVRACGFTDKVPADVAAMRLERLQGVQRELSAARLQAMVGRETVILLEGPSPRPAGGTKQSWQGRDPRGSIVHVPTAGNAGRSVHVRITAAHKHSLLAEEIT